MHSERTREEFLSQRNFIACQIKEVEIKVDGRFTKIEERLEDEEEKMHARVGEVDKQIDIRFNEANKKLDGRLNEVDGKLNGRFNEVGRRFNEVNRKIDGVDKKMRDYLNHMQKASRNFLGVRGWEEIYPIGPLDLYGGIEPPGLFSSQR